MRKIFLSLALGIIFFSNVFGQEQAIYSHYHLFPVLVNPGYTGFENNHQFILNARRNWTGFPGAPTTYTMMYNGPIGDKLALGGGLFTEKIGSQSITRLQLNYAFRFKISQLQMGIGLSTEFLNRSISSGLLNNPLVAPNDQVLEDAASGQKIFDASVGAFALYNNQFFLGLSLPNTIRARLDQAPIDDNSTQNSLFQFYIFQMGYIFNIEHQNIKLIPSMSLRSVRNVPYQIDFNLQGRFLDEKLIAGLTLRPSTGGASSFLIGTKYKGVQFIYSYDVSFSRFQQYNGGSHELSLAFSVAKKQAKVDPNQRF